MEAIALMGMDLGKRTYHVHAQDRRGHLVMRKVFNRDQLSLRGSPLVCPQALGDGT